MPPLPFSKPPFTEEKIVTVVADASPQTYVNKDFVISRIKDLWKVVIQGYGYHIAKAIHLAEAAKEHFTESGMLCEETKFINKSERKVVHPVDKPYLIEETITQVGLQISLELSLERLADVPALLKAPKLQPASKLAEPRKPDQAKREPFRPPRLEPKPTAEPKYSRKYEPKPQHRPNPHPQLNPEYKPMALPESQRKPDSKPQPHFNSETWQRSSFQRKPDAKPTKILDQPLSFEDQLEKDFPLRCPRRPIYRRSMAHFNSQSDSSGSNSPFCSSDGGNHIDLLLKHIPKQRQDLREKKGVWTRHMKTLEELEKLSDLPEKPPQKTGELKKSMELKKYDPTKNRHIGDRPSPPLEPLEEEHPSPLQRPRFTSSKTKWQKASTEIPPPTKSEEREAQEAMNQYLQSQPRGMAAMEMGVPMMPNPLATHYQLQQMALAQQQLAQQQMAQPQFSSQQMAPSQQLQLAQQQMAQLQLAEAQMAQQQLAQSQMAHQQLAQSQMAQQQLAQSQMTSHQQMAQQQPKTFSKLQDLHKSQEAQETRPSGLIAHPAFKNSAPRTFTSGSGDPNKDKLTKSQGGNRIKGAKGGK